MWLYMTLYLQQVLGLSAIEAGLVFLPGTLLNFVVAGATALGRAEGVRARVLVAGGLALIAAGLALLTLVDADSSWWLFLPGLLVAMVGTGMLNPAVAPGRAELGAAGAERPRRRRQRHVPPGRHRGRRRRPRRADPAAPRSARPQAYVDGLHDALWVGAALAARGRRRDRAADSPRRARAGR